MHGRGMEATTDHQRALDAIDSAIEACTAYIKEYAEGKKNHGWGYAKEAAKVVDMLVRTRAEVISQKLLEGEVIKMDIPVIKVDIPKPPRPPGIHYVNVATGQQPGCGRGPVGAPGEPSPFVIAADDPRA